MAACVNPPEQVLNQQQVPRACSAPELFFFTCLSKVSGSSHSICAVTALPPTPMYYSVLAGACLSDCSHSPVWLREEEGTALQGGITQRKRLHITRQATKQGAPTAGDGPCPGVEKLGLPFCCLVCAALLPPSI